MTASTSRAHWLVPSLMIGSPICGIAFALGHHFFYASLEAQIVQSSNQQEWNIRIGTGMAFLVKAFLTAAVGFAYTQFLWTTLRSCSSTLEGIDAMFGVATNAWDFLNLEMWRKGLGLVAIAGILWALPLVAVFTPAALTVQPSSESNKTIHRLHLPTLNFSNPQTFSIWGGDGMAGYVAPSIAVSRLVSSVASQGSIIPMKAPFPNSSFSTSFHAPSLSCRPMGGGPGFHAAFDKLFLNLTEPNYGAGSREKTFFSFVPQHPLGLTKNETDDWKTRALLGLQAVLDKAGSAMLDTVDIIEDPGSPCWFYVGFPIVQGYANRTIQCGLYNSSYDVEWKFNNGEQTATVRNMTRLNPVSTVNADNKLTYHANGRPDVPYVAVMDALGALLMGWIQSTRFDVMEPSRTQILSTVLTQTYEMQHLRHSALKIVPIEPQSSHRTNLTMVEAIEQLVANISLSLFSVGDFLNDKTGSPIGNITSESPLNKYSYNPRNLYAAYGTGIFVTLIVVILGLVCIAVSSKSYKSNFSTILRTTRNEELDVLVTTGETTGAEPLSEHLGKTKLKFRCNPAEDNTSSGSAFSVVSGGKASSYEPVSAMPRDSSPSQSDDNNTHASQRE